MTTFDCHLSLYSSDVDNCGRRSGNGSVLIHRFWAAKGLVLRTKYLWLIVAFVDENPEYHHTLARAYHNLGNAILDQGKPRPPSPSTRRQSGSLTPSTHGRSTSLPFCGMSAGTGRTPWNSLADTWKRARNGKRPCVCGAMARPSSTGRFFRDSQHIQQLREDRSFYTCRATASDRKCRRKPIPAPFRAVCIRPVNHITSPAPPHGPA